MKIQCVQVWAWYPVCPFKRSSSSVDMCHPIGIVSSWHVVGLVFLRILCCPKEEQDGLSSWQERLDHGSRGPSALALYPGSLAAFNRPLGSHISHQCRERWSLFNSCAAYLIYLIVCVHPVQARCKREQLFHVASKTLSQWYHCRRCTPLHWRW